MRPFEKRKDFLVTFFLLQKAFPSFSSLRVPLSPSLRVSFFLSLRLFPFLSLRGAKRRSNLSQHPVIANRRVGKCVGVKQSPRCSFLLVLGVLRGLLRSLRSLAMTKRECSLAMTVWGCRLTITQWGCSLAMA